MSIRTTSTPAGGATVPGPSTRQTSAPRAAASAASATPILPLERFPMKRTGSIGSCVGPAVITIRRPARSPGRDRGHHRRHDRPRARSCGPCPVVAVRERTIDGPDEPHPARLERGHVRLRGRGWSTSRCASPARRRAGRRTRAGLRSAGRRRARARASRSSCAVARRDDGHVGCVRESDVQDRRRVGPTARCNAGRPVSAANVSAPTKRVADSVMTTRSRSAPAATSEPRQDRRLVRGDAAGDPEQHPAGPRRGLSRERRAPRWRS